MEEEAARERETPLRSLVPQTTKATPLYQAHHHATTILHVPILRLAHPPDQSHPRQGAESPPPSSPHTSFFEREQGQGAALFPRPRARPPRHARQKTHSSRDNAVPQRHRDAAAAGGASSRRAMAVSFVGREEEAALSLCCLSLLDHTPRSVSVDPPRRHHARPRSPPPNPRSLPRPLNVQLTGAPHGAGGPQASRGCR